MPITAPMINAPVKLTNPHEGVIATKPATAPEIVPNMVGFPVVIHSTTAQLTAAAAPAVLVEIKALTAIPLAANAEPALKPSHPNHSNAAPKTTKGRLCKLGCLIPIRLPKNKAVTRPATPQLISTTVPPAKSKSPHDFIKPPGAQAICAIGQYTKVSHSTVNIKKAENLTRSA